MIALLTPTGGRPFQIKLCVEWMKKQIYKGDVLWVIVDDVIPNTIDFISDFNNFKIEKVYPKPSWKKGQNTQVRNLLSGLKTIEQCGDIDYIFFIEDDDYYSDRYLEEMLIQLDGYEAAGQKRTVYFNVKNGAYKKCPNTKHASLFQTAIRGDKLDLFKQLLNKNRNGKFVDVRLWENLDENKTNLFYSKDISIGIKGLTGRKGIGGGHRLGNKNNINKEQGFNKLKELIGSDYLKYSKGVGYGN